QARVVVSRLDEILTSVPVEPSGAPAFERNTQAPTAVFLVNGYNVLVIHAMLAGPRLFGSHLKNFVFVSGGAIDSRRCIGAGEVDSLRESVVDDLKKYVRMARSGGMYAEYWYALGTDAIDEVEKLCEQVVTRFPRAVFFAGKLVFQEENFITRLL